MIKQKPYFSLRGIHLNGWAFNYPYTFRCWKEPDWKRYIDLLACQGVNLFLLWPFMEIIPLPLSSEDKAYLREVRRVVSYARDRHKMEVWLFQSANRVALNDCGVRNPRYRPYWVLKAQGEYPGASQVDLNPADPKQFARIMKSRETLYRLVDNADGYCTIDCDPGGWKDSPLEDYTRILRASRVLLNRHTVLGKCAKLITWLWYGWSYCWTRHREWWQPGADPHPLNRAVAETIRTFKTQLPEPWWLIAGQREYLRVCAAEGVLGKTVFLPYGFIEGEPSRPGTQIDFQRQLEYADELPNYPGLAGLMGNVQTPLLQFPHVNFLLNVARSYGKPKETPGKSLLDLAASVYQEQSALLADCWESLVPPGRAHAGKLRRRLERLLKAGGLGQPGILGKNLFPDCRQVARDLVFQLKISSAFEGLLRNSLSCRKLSRWADSVGSFLDAALSWDKQHGWSAYWKKLGKPWTLWPDHAPAFPAIVQGLRKALGGTAISESAVAQFLSPIGRKLARHHDGWIVTQCGIQPLQKVLIEEKP